MIKDEDFEVATINVWSGLDYVGSVRMGEYEPGVRREKRYRILVGQPRNLAPEVVALNETDEQPSFTRWVVGSRDLVKYIRLAMLASKFSILVCRCI